MFDGVDPAELLGLRSFARPGLALDPDDDDINRALLGLWPLTESCGTIADDLSPYQSRGTLVGAPTRIVGAQGQATNFNGSTQYISASRTQVIPGGFSAVAWINVTTGFDRVILSSIYSTDNTILWRATSNGTQFDFWANTGVPQATASGLTSFAGRWICAGVSWAPGRATRFYINGVDVGGGSTSGDIQTPISAWHIGRYGYPGIWYFSGAMRLVRVWGRVLPVADFRRLYSEPFAGIISEDDRLYIGRRGGAAPTVHDLTAPSIASASTVGTPALGQVHALAAPSIASASAVGTPALGQIHAITAPSIASVSTVGAPALGQVHALTAPGIASASAVGAPALGLAHTLTAPGIASASAVGAPALGQVHAITAPGIASVSTVGTPALGQVHALTAPSIASASTVGAPALNADDGLPAEWIPETALTTRNIRLRAPGTPRARTASNRLAARTTGALRGPGDPS